MEIEKNKDHTFNVWGDEPVKITFFDSDTVQTDGQTFKNVEKFSVIVRGGFDLVGCEGIVEEKDKLRAYMCKRIDCDDVEILES